MNQNFQYDNYLQHTPKNNLPKLNNNLYKIT